MEIMKIAVIAVAGTVLAVVLKEQKKEYALYVTLATVIVIFSMIIMKISAVFELISSWQKNVSFGNLYISVILKILGIAYISDITAQICRDAGEGAIGGKVELAGKVMIFYIAIPVMTSIMEIVGKLLP